MRVCEALLKLDTLFSGGGRSSGGNVW